MNHTKTLDKWRKFKGVSIEELAEKSGLTVSTIYRMEQNHKHIDWETIVIKTLAVFVIATYIGVRTVYTSMIVDKKGGD